MHDAFLPLTTALFVGASLLPVFAQEGPEVELSGFVQLDTRLFPEAPKFSDQERTRLNPSIALQPELRLYWDTVQITAIPYLRYDPDDHEGRTHADFRELNVYQEGDDWDLTAGLGKVFWGVVESRHLVDIVNQTDGVENTDGEDKLGQPMVNLNLLRDWGTVGLFVLPGFRERTFVGEEARLRGALSVDTDRPIYESGAGEKHVDFAGRYSHTFGDYDLGLSYFHGTSREPELIADTDASGKAVLRPRYEIIDQLGLDLQAVLDAWLWKLEAMHRSGHGDAFAALSGGVEYSFYGLYGGDADLGLLAEYHYDGRGDDAPGSLFDNDIFLGARYVLNDAFDTEFLGGGLVDQRTQSVLFSVEASRRLTDTWRLDAEAQFFLNGGDDPIVSGIEDDGFFQVSLTRFF